MNNSKFTLVGILGAIAVAFGALGAHFLKQKMQIDLLTTDQLNGFDTGVKYQIYHVIVMLFLILWSQKTSHKYLVWAYNCFLTGIIMFSGSLYFLCTRNLFGADWLKALGPITPIGGLFFIAGWIFIALVGIQKKS